jgi:hypothetical protein
VFAIVLSTKNHTVEVFKLHLPSFFEQTQQCHEDEETIVDKEKDQDTCYEGSKTVVIGSNTYLLGNMRHHPP